MIACTATDIHTLARIVPDAQRVGVNIGRIARQTDRINGTAADLIAVLLLVIAFREGQK